MSKPTPTKLPASGGGPNRAERRGRARRPLLTLAEAADEIGVSDRTLRRYIASGRLPVIRINRRVLRIHPDAMDKFLGIAD